MLAVAAGYFMGSIPFGLLLSRWLAGVDPRQVGSGNIGATNAMRAGGRRVGVLTLIADMLKGALPVAVSLLLSEPVTTALVVLAAVLGHLFPVWLGFRGGKGVATMLGVMAVWQPWAAVSAAVVWLAIYYTTRYVSLASIVAGVVPTLLLILMGHNSIEMLVAALLSLLLIARHRANIERLLGGKEPRTQ
ncbi:MAG: glycerol-3-phosphate 1-O-acyltransferase PlsY [Mariprofundales bacterium]|nr:glycerol-3-phosphate 1-O-acyltransferase PlsY [Mariprofundales bacterium]